jgi:hypothetical protein
MKNIFYSCVQESRAGLNIHLQILVRVRPARMSGKFNLTQKIAAKKMNQQITKRASEQPGQRTAGATISHSVTSDRFSFIPSHTPAPTSSVFQVARSGPLQPVN